MTNSSNYSKPQSGLGFWLVAIALLAGLILSFLSWIEFCVEHCSANQDYRLFGLPFAFIGMTVFPILLIFHFLSPYFPLFRTLRNWILAGALGSEIMFIIVQHYQIGAWCPVCLSIAAAVAIASVVLLVGYLQELNSALNQSNRGIIMYKVKKAFASLSFVMLMGFLFAFVGISKINPAEAAAAEMKEKLAFGKKGSPVEVYFVTDWYCTACRKIDPIFEKFYPELRQKATVFFIDYPIHKKSTNFIPYNISFLVNNKSQYFLARKALDELADKNDAPTDKEVTEIAKKYKIDFKELPYLEIKTGMDFFEKVIEKFGLNSTPTIVVINTKTNKIVKLEGADGISEEKIKKALEEVSQDKK